MKKYTFLTLCLCSLYACSEKRPAAVERPAFDVWNSGTLEIDKIEMSDSATILYVDAFYSPGQWIRISGETYIKTYAKKSESSEKLPLAKAEGVNPDEELYMPESGKASFKLFFPPLPPSVTKIDLIESDCPDCFKIWGIRLLPGDKIKTDPIPKSALTGKASKPLPPPAFAPGTAKLSGKFFGYVDGCLVGTKEVTVKLAEALNSSSENSVKFPIAADGSFSGEILIDRPQLAYFYESVIFLTPGSSQEIYIDLKKINRLKSLYRTDKEPDDSLYMYAISPENYCPVINFKTLNETGRLFDLSRLLPKLAEMSDRDELKEYLLGELRAKLEELKQAGLPDNVQILLAQNMKADVLRLLLEADELLDYAYYYTNRKNRNEGKPPQAPAAEYYSFLKELVDDKLSYSPSYPSRLSELRKAAAFSRPEGGTVAEKFAYFKEKISPLLGTDKGFLFDMVHAQLFADQLQASVFYTDADKQLVRETFAGNPAIADALIAENDKMQALIAEAKANKTSVIREVPAVSEGKVFDAILAGYKGKVVLVDFWATWCGPCIRAHEQLKPLKAEWEGKPDVVFLYLTGETSPLTNWYKMVPDIHGEHYRVSGKQFDYWYKVFDIPGVPTYFIYDRNGKRTFRSTGFPGVDKIRGEIGKLL